MIFFLRNLLSTLDYMNGIVMFGEDTWKIKFRLYAFSDNALGLVCIVR